LNKDDTPKMKILQRGKSSNDGNADVSKRQKKNFSLKPFSKKTNKNLLRHEEYVEEILLDSDDESREATKKKGFFKGFTKSKSKESPTKSIGQTVLLSEEDLDDDHFFSPEKSQKIQNAESFIAERIQQIQTNSLIKEEQIRTIDIEATESISENNKATKLFNSRGVMVFDGMIEDEDNDEEEDIELDKERSSDKLEESRKLTFIKAPNDYDPVSSGFYRPNNKKKNIVTPEEEEAIEVVEEYGVCCTMWD